MATEYVNGCEKCHNHDQDTKKIVESFLHKDGATLLTMLLAACIRHKHGELNMMSKKNPNRIAKQCEADFANQLLGKFLIAFDDAYRETILNVIRSNFGLDLKIQHEPCPHPGASLAAVSPAPEI